MKTEIYSLSELKKDDASLTASIAYDAVHAVFTGHFPENPIVPGVCTLDMITDVVNEACGGGYVLQAASNVKFLQLIRPTDSPALTMSWSGPEGALQVQATITLNEVVMMRFGGTYIRG